MTERCREYLTLTCFMRIRLSMRLLLGSEGNHKTVAWLEQEIATSQRRLRAIEFEFRVKGWVLPDYSIWQKTGVYPYIVEDRPRVIPIRPD